MKTTQCERILNYIEFFGSISSLQAIRDLGCMRLASRVNDLKRMGFPVRKRLEKVTNRFGEPAYVAVYYLEREEENSFDE